MGYTEYSVDARTVRSASLGYTTKSVDEVFTQQKSRVIHETLDPNGIQIRECRDSETHPNTVPVILALDVTGSMGHIPHELIKEGLPKLMGNIIQKGVKDVSLCFMAIGDHECDRYPLQIAQFESGDEELDMWLTRTYLESGGGGNAGESYHLAWQAATDIVVTDAWEKRKQKGILITIGDEDVLNSIPVSAINEIYGESKGHQSSISTNELLQKVQEKWDVYHIHVDHNSYREHEKEAWTQRLGKNCIIEKDFKKIPDVVTELVVSHNQKNGGSQVINEVVEPKSTESIVSPSSIDDDDDFL